MSDYTGENVDVTITPDEPLEVELVLTEEEQKALCYKLKRLYDTFQNDISGLHKEIGHWWKSYEARVTDITAKNEGDDEFPWEGSSKFMPPLIQAHVNTYHSRIVSAVFDVDPLFLARPRTSEGKQIAHKSEWYLDYWCDQANITEKLDTIVLSMLVEGTGVAKLGWARRTVEVESPEPPQDPEAEPDVQEIVEYEGFEIQQVPLRDFVVIPANSPTLDDAVYQGHRVFRTEHFLKEAAAAGYYSNVSKLLKASGDRKEPVTPRASRLVQDSTKGNEDTEVDSYEIVELYGKFDLGDGKAVPAVVTFSPQHKVILRAEPSPYFYGRPPYQAFVVDPVPGLWFGRSIPEVLESAQEEIAALHNARADGISRLVNPPILKRMGSMWDEEKDPLRPGKVITVQDPKDIQEFLGREIPSSLFAHEQDILAFVERQTGLSDYSMGRMQSQYATATAVQKVTTSGLARVDVAISRFQSGMKRMSWFMWWMLYQFRPLIDRFYAQNSDMTITKAEMRPSSGGLMPFEFIPQGMLSDISKDNNRNQAFMLMQALGPVLQQNYPDGLHALADDVLKAYDVHDRASILGPPWGLLQQQLQQLQQQAYQQGQQDALAQIQGG